MRFRAFVLSTVLTLAGLCGSARADGNGVVPTSPLGQAAVETGRLVALVPFFEALDRANTEAYLVAQRDQALTDARAAALRARGAQASSSRSTDVPAGRCPIESDIRAAFPDDPDWAVHVAIRESNCRPEAYNRSGASGVFQLLGHQDILDRVCPGVPNNAFDASCNIAAARQLYDGSGRRPWGG